MKECKSVQNTVKGVKKLDSIYGEVIFSESMYGMGIEELEIRLRGETIPFFIRSKSNHRIDVKEWVKFHFNKNPKYASSIPVKAYELYFSDRDHVVKYRHSLDLTYEFVDE